MDKMSFILLDMEDIIMKMAGVDNISQIEKDVYKARRIYDLYGLEYFMKFLELYPHIGYLAKDHLLCAREGGQCNLFCIYYKGGCSYATN